MHHAFYRYNAAQMKLCAWDSPFTDSVFMKLVYEKTAVPADLVGDGQSPVRSIKKTASCDPEDGQGGTEGIPLLSQGSSRDETEMVVLGDGRNFTSPTRRPLYGGGPTPSSQD
jgi:hypothetical protein